jgi:citrate synthase
MAKSGKGLEGVVAAETALSDIDGQKGILFYVGYDIHDLADNATFEEIIYLLHHLELPDQSQLEELKQQLGEGREPNSFAADILPELARRSQPMEMLRTAVSASQAEDPDGEDNSEEANYRKAIRLCAVVPTLAAQYDRLRNDKDVIAPDPNLSQAANFLYMLNGDKADDESVDIFDTCLVLHADHTMNASTFSARVAAATLSDIHSAITSAICALKGPLHGGANEQVRKMLDEISESGADPKDYLKAKIDRKEKVMGFGHRVYKTEDPRATHLRAMSKNLAEKKGDGFFYETSLALEEAMKEIKGIDPNVDFYAASVYSYLEIPTDLFTPVFACSRISGWTAHVREQYADNRLIRPDHGYVGPEPRDWVAQADR